MSIQLNGLPRECHHPDQETINRPPLCPTPQFHQLTSIAIDQFCLLEPHVVSSIWFLLFNITFPRLSLCGCMCQSLVGTLHGMNIPESIIYSIADGHLGEYPVLMVSSDTISYYKQCCSGHPCTWVLVNLMYAFLLGFHPGAELLS